MIAEPDHLFVCFDPQASAWWVRWLARGRFKHVRAFGLVPVARLWIFYDVTLSGTAIRCARDKSPEADALIQAWADGCEVLHIARKPAGGLPRWPVFSCVSAIGHLIGLHGALRPDTLHRDCLANGAKVIDEGQTAAESDDAARSAA